MDLFSTPEELDRERWQRRLQEAGYKPELGRSGAIIGWVSPTGERLHEDSAIAQLKAQEVKDAK